LQLNGTIAHTTLLRQKIQSPLQRQLVWLSLMYLLLSNCTMTIFMYDWHPWCRVTQPPNPRLYAPPTTTLPPLNKSGIYGVRPPAVCERQCSYSELKHTIYSYPVLELTVDGLVFWNGGSDNYRLRHSFRYVSHFLLIYTSKSQC
jgi:hypothetical protein